MCTRDVTRVPHHMCVWRAKDNFVKSVLSLHLWICNTVWQVPLPPELSHVPVLTFQWLSFLLLFLLSWVEGVVGRNVEEAQSRVVLLLLVLLSLTLKSSDTAVWPSHRGGVGQERL